MPILSRNANIRQKLFEGATLLFLLLGLPIVVKAQSVPICAAGQNASQHGFQCSLGGLTFSNFATDPPTDPLAISAATDKSGSVELSFLSAPGVFDFTINGAVSQVSLVGSFASVCEGFTGSLATPCAGKSLGGLSGGRPLQLPSSTSKFAVFLDCECRTLPPLSFIFKKAGCEVKVAPASQFGPNGLTNPLQPWGSNQYDHLTADARGQLTIGRKGCALTALAMALNFAGANLDPGSLNIVLNGIAGAYSPSRDGIHGGEVNWLAATAAGGLANALHFDTLGGFIDSDVDLSSAEKAVEDELCAQSPHPVIVGVRSPKTGIYDLVHGPGHFVLITGEIINPDGSKAFSINDPAGYSTILGSSGGQSFYTNAQGNPEFSTRGIVNDPEDFSSLSIMVDANATIVVTDPAGLQTGFDPTTGNPLQNITRSAAFIDALDDDVTGEVDTAPVRSVLVNLPLSGTYDISVAGLSVAPYTLSATVVSTDGTIQNTIQISGISDLKSNASVQLSISSAPGSNPKAVKQASLASTLADISNSLQLGFIDNGGIANSLAKKILAAQEATGAARNNILVAFRNEVNAQSNKHITGIASQVLIEDANALVNQSIQ